MAGVTCVYSDFCQNRQDKGTCHFCIYSPYPRPDVKESKFVSCKCGSQAMLCAHLHDADYCDDCDPYDAPCSLYKYTGVL